MFSLWLGKGAPLADLRLIDLPGYGYAKVARTERNSWQPLIEGYTRRRKLLALFVILVDARRGLEGRSGSSTSWLGTEHVPAQVVYTKVDKLSATERGLLKEQSRKSFGRRAPISVSSESGEGLVALWSAIFEFDIRDGDPRRVPKTLPRILRRAKLGFVHAIRPHDKRSPDGGQQGPASVRDRADAPRRHRRGHGDRAGLLPRPWSAQVFQKDGARRAHVDVVRDAAEGFWSRSATTAGGRRDPLLDLATHLLARRVGMPRAPGRHHHFGASTAAGSSRSGAALNAAALRLYRRFAFRPVGVRPTMTPRTRRRDCHAAGLNSTTTTSAALFPLAVAPRGGAPGGATDLRAPSGPPPLSGRSRG